MTVANTDASIWQRAEIIGGATDEVARLVRRIEHNLHVGHDGPEKTTGETARPRRSGIDGYLEDRYDELCGIRDALQGILGYVGQSGEGPRGELSTPKAYAADGGNAVTGERRW